MFSKNITVTFLPFNTIFGSVNRFVLKVIYFVWVDVIMPVITCMFVLMKSLGWLRGKAVAPIIPSDRFACFQQALKNEVKSSAGISTVPHSA